MDHVAVAQLIFAGTSTEMSFWSIFSAHVTDTFGLCNDFANRDQRSLFATFQSHSSISSIKSVNELQCHSVSVRAKRERERQRERDRERERESVCLRQTSIK